MGQGTQPHGGNGCNQAKRGAGKQKTPVHLLTGVATWGVAINLNLNTYYQLPCRKSLRGGFKETIAVAIKKEPTLLCELPFALLGHVPTCYRSQTLRPRIALQSTICNYRANRYYSAATTSPLAPEGVPCWPVVVLMSATRMCICSPMVADAPKRAVYAASMSASDVATVANPMNR